MVDGYSGYPAIPVRTPLTAIGKIVVHREKWVRWFADNDGIVIVHGQGINYQYAHQLCTRVRRHLEGFEPSERLRRRKASKTRPRRQPKKPAGQQRLIG